MFKRHPDAGLKDDRVIDVPAIGAGVATTDPPLIKKRNSKIGGARGLQTPRRKKIILGPCAPNRRLGLPIDVDLFVAFAEPSGAACANGQHRSDIMSFALRVEDKVILAMLNGIFLPVLRVKIRRILRD